MKKRIISITILSILSMLNNSIYGINRITRVIQDEYLNAAFFGTPCYWSDDDSPLGCELVSGTSLLGEDPVGNLGIRWSMPRDIQRLEIVCHTPPLKKMVDSLRVEYWHDTWPDRPPQMPSYEDEEDDLWRGKWVQADIRTLVNGNRVVCTFLPLRIGELPTADRLPGEILYRRTLKIRVKFPSEYRSVIDSVEAYTMAALRKERFRIEFLQDGEAMGSVSAFNGFIHHVSGWNWAKGDRKSGKAGWQLDDGKRKGVVIEASTARCLLSGSNEETILTVRTNRGTFSFATDDVADGPMYLPDFGACITSANDSVSFLPSVIHGSGIRSQIMSEAEHSYDRARHEIPVKDPTCDQSGNRIYLPLACDANWQKFAVEWGGNLIIDKGRTNLRGKALSLCNWNGHALIWSFGTGEEPCYLRNKDNCRMSVLNDCLPVVSAQWRHEGLLFEEETFVTFADGVSFSPIDTARNEFTPAVLMVKLRVSNPSLQARQAHLRLQGNSALTEVVLEDGSVYDLVGGQKFLRAQVSHVKNDAIQTAVFNNDAGHGIGCRFFLDANSSETFYFRFPFIGNLTPVDARRLALLDYAAERDRVIEYWRGVISANTVFNVPEPTFNALAKSTVAHIRMSITKEPESGLYLAPAATFSYPVYANESIFQTHLLDRLGDVETVRNCIETFLQLQGSCKLPGAYTGDQKSVFHGVRISEDIDYTALGYNMNHGVVLWGMAHHYLHSRDKVWLERVAPQLMRAADWIIEQRNQTKLFDRNGEPVLHYGLLPAGMLEDCYEWRYWYATNAYAYLGMKSMAEAFAEAKMPQAEYYRVASEAYRTDILHSLQRAMEQAPVVRLRNNTCIPYVPVHPYQRFRYFGAKKSEYYDRYGMNIRPTLRLSATREVLYGPVTLLKTGLIDPYSKMAEWILNDWEDNLTLSSSMGLNTHGWVDDEFWFSRGGMVFQAGLQNPISVYLDRHETQAAIRSLYNNFTALYYPDVVMLSEEYRMWEHASGPFYKTPDEARMVSQILDMLIDEQGDEVWLANGVPQRWLEVGQRVELFGVQTRFGLFSYVLKPGVDANTIEAEVMLPDCLPDVRLFVHAPFGKPIREVTINDRLWTKWDAERQAIVLPKNERKQRIIVRY